MEQVPKIFKFRKFSKVIQVKHFRDQQVNGTFRKFKLISLFKSYFDSILSQYKIYFSEIDLD